MFTRREKQGEGVETVEGKEEGYCGGNYGTEDCNKEGKMKR